jgi:uncharacterized YccA/Bax inhibitor family protein
MAIRTSNPAMSSRVFNEVETVSQPSEAMTVQGSIYKTSILLGLLLLTAVWVWHLFYAAAIPGQADQTAALNAVMPWMVGGIIGGLVFAVITIFVPKVSPYTSPAYALCEGLALGGISAIFELQYPGIVMPAVGGTFGVLAVMLGVYATGLVKVTDKFRMGVVAATGGIALLYIVAMVMSLFGAHMPIIDDATPLGIGFSVVVVIIAALNLVLDFDFIDRGAQAGLPRYMEWYGAFGLMLTLVWLYLEILRLLAKMRR